MFLSNNRIDKFESFACLKDCSQVSELALDGNPVATKKGYTEFCLSSCANLKLFDMRKVTAEMRDGSASGTASTAAETDKSKERSAPESIGLTSSTDYMDKFSNISNTINPPSLVGNSSTPFQN